MRLEGRTGGVSIVSIKGVKDAAMFVLPALTMIGVVHFTHVEALNAIAQRSDNLECPLAIAWRIEQVMEFSIPGNPTTCVAG
jgi:hypothetical protein